MKTIIKYIRLPFDFSVTHLEEELKNLDEEWISHFNRAHYEGEWSALPLRSVNGSLTNVIPGNGLNENFADTILMNKCPYIKSILANFPCEHKAVRMLKLRPGALIKEHRDFELCYEQGEARIHVPIITNPGVEFYLENERVEMVAGSCWYMNFNLPHRIYNSGSTDRVHLVIDLVINEKISQMFDCAPVDKKKIIPAEEEFSREEKINIIKLLREMNTVVAIDLAKKMEAELGASI